MTSLSCLSHDRASVRVSEANLHRIVDVISALPPEKIDDMQRQVAFLFDKYFQSMAKIALTTLQVNFGPKTYNKFTYSFYCGVLNFACFFSDHKRPSVSSHWS